MMMPCYGALRHTPGGAAICRAGKYAALECYVDNQFFAYSDGLWRDIVCDAEHRRFAACL